MHFIDWAIVIVLNGAIIAYGLFRSRDTKSSADWFLAGRSLPWWIVGLSLYATAIDSSDVVADSGHTYGNGMAYFATNWVGVILGWFIAAHYTALPMYRAGMYTNAEYLEARFGPSARVISALVQVQYRTLVLGIMANTIYLVLKDGCGWGPGAWWVVWAMAGFAAVYTALGGLKSVAVTDALQTGIMVVASITLFVLIWNVVGGWSGIEGKLEAHEAGLSRPMLHTGEDTVSVSSVEGKSAEEIDRQLILGGEYDPEAATITKRTPAWIVAIAWVMVGLMYSIVNHTQSMRLFGSRSEWDLKMSIVIAGVILLVTTFTNLMIGIMGRALYPEIGMLPEGRGDSIYPFLLAEYAGVFFKGLIVAGIVAATLSTFDSIGSTLSSLLVRDVYARIFVRDRDDHHYLRVGQWLTPLIIFGSFAYVPFFEGGMLLFYLDLVGSIVVPLMTIYLFGIFSRVHRSSGSIALAVGVLYGVVRLFAPKIAATFGVAVLPPIMVDNYANYLFSFGITGAAMILVSLWRGWEPRGDLLHKESGGWLRSSQEQVSEIEAVAEPRSTTLSLVLGLLIVGIGLVLCFVVFW